MKIKYSLSCLLFFIILLSLNVVMAADNDFNCSAIENSVLETNCDNLISISNDLDSVSEVNSNPNINDNLEEDTLGASEDGMNHVYVSPTGTGNGSCDNATSFNDAMDNLQSNTIIHMTDGEYNFSSAITKSSLENITILADNPKNVKISNNNSITFKTVTNFILKDVTVENSTNTFIVFDSSKNIQILNCNFMNFNGTKLAVISTTKSGNISIKNCNFTNNNIKWCIILQNTYANIPNTYNININNCKFENNTCNYYSIGVQGNDVVEIYECKFINNSDSSNNVGSEIFITNQNKNNVGEQVRVYDCYFGNRTNPAVHLSKSTDGGLYFKDNIVESNYAIYIDASSKNKITSNTVISILNNENVNVTVGDKIRIPVKLLDDNGHYIHAYYKTSNKKFDNVTINDTTYQFDYYFFVDDHYYVDYTVPNTIGELPIIATCSYFDMELCTVDGAILNVKPAVNFVWNEINNTVYGENIAISINITNLESGNLTYQFIKDNEVIKTIVDSFSNNVSTINVNDLPVGDYTIKVDYADGEVYGHTTTSNIFKVKKANSTIELDILNDGGVYVGDNIIVQAVLPTNATGSVTFRLKGTQQVITVSAETATALFTGLSEGNYSVYATYSGDSNYNESEEFNTTFTVNKKDSEFYIYASDVSLGETAYVYAYLPSDATGTITYYIEGSSPETLDVNEVYSINGLVVGKYSVRADYSGDSNYNASEYTCTFEVTYDFELENDEFGYGDVAVVNIIFPEKGNGTLGVIVDNDYSSPITTSVINGSAVFNLPSNLTPGEHTLALTYQSIETIETNVTINIVPKITSLDDLTTGDNTISLSLPSDATGNLTIRVDDEDSIVVPVVNGTASYDLNNLSAGEHEIYVAYEGNYPEFSDYKTVDVAKATPKSTINVPSSITAGKAVTVPINLPSDATGVVLIDVDGKKYYADVVKGVANVAIPSLTAGDKKLTYKYLGDDKYAPITGSATLKVTNPPAPTPKKDVIKLTLKKVNVKKSAKKLVITATLKINGKAVKGKKITFKFNKKTYTAKTNKKGVAKITVKKAVLKKLKVGKKVTYTAKYSKTTVKKSVKVKK